MNFEYVNVLEPLSVNNYKNSKVNQRVYEYDSKLKYNKKNIYQFAISSSIESCFVQLKITEAIEVARIQITNGREPLNKK